MAVLWPEPLALEHYNIIGYRHSQAQLNERQ